MSTTPSQIDQDTPAPNNNPEGTPALGEVNSEIDNSKIGDEKVSSPSLSSMIPGAAAQPDSSAQKTLVFDNSDKTQTNQDAAKMAPQVETKSPRKASNGEADTSYLYAWSSSQTKYSKPKQNGDSRGTAVSDSASTAMSNSARSNNGSDSGRARPKMDKLNLESNGPAFGTNGVVSAVRRGDIKKLKAMLKEGVPANYMDEDDIFSPRPLLHWAAEEGHSDCVKVLIDNSASVNELDESSCSPLHYAAEGGHIDVIKELLKAGCQKNAVNEYKETPLHWAAKNGHAACLKLLLDEGASRSQRNAYQNTALHWAARDGHVECTKVLVQAGADMDAKNVDSWTPLHWAAEGGHSKVIDLLCRAGSNVNIQDKDQWMALHWAAGNGHYESVHILTKYGADVNAQNKLRCTPLHCAATDGRTKCVEVLLLAGADKSMCDKNGYTAHLYAFQNGHLKCVQLLEKEWPKVTPPPPMRVATKAQSKDSSSFLSSLCCFCKPKTKETKQVQNFMIEEEESGAGANPQESKTNGTA
mmetsp:Transcript_20652/g.24815  ORF Transcript_20652/g.24815 Transcript_20652/m.24815 type:complete len:527 (+) Transcript_20652:426-2006(+)|eukprot:CAMPEP_0197866468 /NCGR_PEP_ID=MMETSP1438-20131217/44233_1 /TAXON_ID=1461541 /ORGANISM="Pterosperma sp., Strain CCMP1384" /LENGTH=526 /DNA_ID=CAMNT_0043485039 /DNA_START=419 /DNA_END=1999 /DNA_ORIENTATION=-